MSTHPASTEASKHHAAADQAAARMAACTCDAIDPCHPCQHDRQQARRHRTLGRALDAAAVATLAAHALA